MSLKTEIDKSNKLKEDLKIAKDKINERILSGGGTRANSISEVPGKIDEMLGQYKKVAVFKNFTTGLCAYNRNNKIKIGTIGFDATKVYAKVDEALGANGDFVYTEPYGYIISTSEHSIINGGEKKYTIRLACEGRNLYFYAYDMNYVGEGRKFKLSDIIAIE